MQVHQAGLLEQARDDYESILAAQPDHADALHLYGVLQCQLGNIDAAIALMQRSLSQVNSNPVVHANLALACFRRGAFEEAASCCRQAISLAPHYAIAHSRLAQALERLGNPEAAAASYRQALDKEPRLKEAYCGLATTLTGLRQSQEAEAVLRQGLGHLPDDPDLLGNLALLLERRNFLDESAKLAEHGLSKAPDHALLALAAAKCARRSGAAEKAISLGSSALPRATEPGLRASLHFELARGLDRDGQYDRAYEHFCHGNALRRQQWLDQGGAPASAYHQHLTALKEQFSKQWVESWSDGLKAPQPDEIDHAPIFLVGFPRSGTTLLDQILDSHPALATIEEQPFTEALVAEVAALPGGYPAALAHLDQVRVAALRRHYISLQNHHVGSASGRRVIDKLPLNLEKAGLLARLFPEARFILVLRHPLDACLSCFMQDFQLNPAMAQFFSLEDSARFYAAMMGLWQQYRMVLPLRVHRVSYERLVEDFDSETRALLDFLEVEWNAGVRDFHHHARKRASIDTPSYQQVSEPLYQRSVGRWQSYRRPLEPVIPLLEPAFKAFGYRAD